MKILHVIPSVAPVRGGPSHAALGMVRTLRCQGIDVEIATTNDNASELLNVPLFQKTNYQGVPVWFLPRFSPPLKEFIFSAALSRWLWKNLKAYDLVHNHYLFSYASTCAGAIARYCKIPYIVRPIGQLTPWALEQSKFKKKIYTSLIERRNLNSAAAIHCTTEEEAQNVRDFGIKSPTFTAPLGVEISPSIVNAKTKLRDLYKISSETPILLFLSRIHYKKRPDLIIQVLGEIAKENKKFHLIIAGSGELEYVDKIKNLVKHYNLENYVSFAGFVTGEDKDLLLQGSDIFLLPSFSENFGIVVPEAMIAGLPVIITPGVQIAPEIADAEAGIIVKGEIGSLQNAISLLLSNPELRIKLGNNGKNCASNCYSWNIISEKIIEIYENIIKKIS